MNPLVSILIAAYNVEEYIEDCLNSCMAQTYNNIEIIVVNDGSTDSTLEIIQQFVAKDNRVIEVSKENGGLVSARISGVEAAKGKYIFFLDGDDTIPKNSIESLVSGLDSNTDIVIANMEMISVDKKIKINSRDFNGGDGLSYINASLKSALPSIVGSLFSIHLFDNVKFPINLYKSLGEDLVTTIQLGYFAKKVKYVPTTTYTYKKRDTSLIGEAKKDSIWASSFEAFIMVTKFLKEKELFPQVLEGYLKLLKTYVMGYLVSKAPIKPYKKELREAILFAHNNWKVFKKDSTELQILAFQIARINLNLSKLIFSVYLRIFQQKN